MMVPTSSLGVTFWPTISGVSFWHVSWLDAVRSSVVPSGVVLTVNESASGAVKDGYNTVREKVEDVDFGAITDQVRTYVRSNPGKALLISVGVGFLIGLLLRRDDED